MVAAATAGFYPGHAVSSQSILRHDEGPHYAPQLQYAAPIVYSEPISQGPYDYLAHQYEGHDEYVSTLIS